jgi:uncharacterized protein (TIGR02266 family)
MQTRRGPRIRIAVEVTAETSHQFYAGLSNDIGFGGVFFVTEEPPPPGTEMEVHIRLPDDSRINARGVVRWVRPCTHASADCPPGCGVAWQSLDRRSLSALRRLMRSAGRSVFDGNAAST